MTNSVAQAYSVKSKLPTYLPMAEATRKYGLSEKFLTQLIEAGKIEAVRLSSGEILVSAENGHYRTKEDIIAKEFKHLRGQSITVSAAAENYALNRDTILDWVKRKYINTLKPGYRMELDEADVAYCAKIYSQKLKEYRGQLRGVTIFDEYGNPYELMHPDLAERRRQQQD